MRSLNALVAVNMTLARSIAKEKKGPQVVGLYYKGKWDRKPERIVLPFADSNEVIAQAFEKFAAYKIEVALLYPPEGAPTMMWRRDKDAVYIQKVGDTGAYQATREDMANIIKARRGGWIDKLSVPD